MANNVNNVTAGKPKIGGAVFVAPVTAVLPTDAVTELDAAFEELGYISEDGLTQAITRDSEAIKAWGGDTVMTTQTDYAETFSFTMIEVMREAVRKVAFGDTNVTGNLAEGMITKVNSKELKHTHSCLNCSITAQSAESLYQMEKSAKWATLLM